MARYHNKYRCAENADSLLSNYLFATTGNRVSPGRLKNKTESEWIDFSPFPFCYLQWYVTNTLGAYKATQMRL